MYYIRYDYGAIGFSLRWNGYALRPKYHHPLHLMTSMFDFMRRCMLAAIIFVTVPAMAAGKATPELTVFAASSLTNVMQELSDAYTQATGVPVRLSFAASSALARQIESGARADVFFSADIEWMDYLQRRQLIDGSSRRDVVGNALVLIAPADSKVQLKIAPNFPLARTLGSGRLATGDPDSVPVGRYARSALTQLGVWNDVAARIVRTENVRTALIYVDRGEAPLGIVYATDAFIDKKVQVVDTFPANSHPPITYPIATTKVAKPGAAAFVEYVRSNAADAVFEKYGFLILQ
jgi:molybdate transport system substrate-binding protein